MYHKIYEFCKVKNKGVCYKNGVDPTPRVQYILDLCKEMGLSAELDIWGTDEEVFDYLIMDAPEILRTKTDLDPEKVKAVRSLYFEFSKEAEDFLSDKGVDEDPKFIEPDMMDMLGDEYGDIVDKYTEELKDIVGQVVKERNNFFNIMLTGSSDKFVVAHHDIVNPNSDNANDNSCSVINALAIKKKRPNVNVVILDGEEVGGIGSERLSQRIKGGDFKCKWILNLELTGRGGTNFFVGAMGTNLTQWIANRFECPIVKVPFNDSVIFKKYGIDSTVINPLPITNKETPIINKDGDYLDYSMLFNCHKMTDSVDTIDVIDMKEFVEDVCLKIIDEA
jgi:hypothetical protein